MIPLHKLAELSPGQRRRKLALLLGAAERELVAFPGASMPGLDRPVPRTGVSAPHYVRSLSRLVLEDPKVDRAAASEIARLAEMELASGGSEPFERARASGGERSVSGNDAIAGADSPGDALLVRLCNASRHAILAAIGTFPAEWDLIHRSSGESGERAFFPGVAAYAEDIRSPFNLGSIFRTAEAYGAERLIISPLCVAPEHPRATRSAMGCVDFLPWERRSLAELPVDTPVFSLETGGTPIDEFDFPPRGIVVIGSEELGVSPEALERADYGRVSIPMHGIKASLNVGVAFGVLMQAWTSYLRCSASKPF